MEMVDVVVVGAGIAGLSCARALVRQGRTVVVLEARNRIGGRIWTLYAPDQPPLELGAQVIHGDRAATWAVLHEAGLVAAPQPLIANLLFQIGGQAYPVGEVLRTRVLPPWTAEQMLAQVAVDRSVREVLGAQGVSGLGLTLAEEWLSQSWCADPADLSVLGIRQIHQAREEGSGEFIVAAGYDRLPAYLAQGLDIRLHSPVTRIHWGADKVTVVTDQASWQARAAVLTVPPPVIAAGGIMFDPPLPAPKMAAARAIPLGDAMVVVAHLADAAPQSAWALTVDPVGGFWRTEAGVPRLGGWLKGPTVQQVRGQPYDESLMRHLAGGAFPWLQTIPITAVQVVDWGADPYSQGGYSYPRVGALEQPQIWAAALDQRLFFAGEATTGFRHPALVHGALESGERAAAEVLRIQ